MIHRTLQGLAIVTCVFFARSPGFAEDMTPAGEAFEKLKALAGAWVDPGEDPASTADDIDATYEVTSAGHAVVETLFAGTPHEMVTMYYLDGSAVELTHYCAIGNRPRLRAVPTVGATVLQFECAGLSSGEEAQHMHSLAFTFVDEGRVQHDWTSVGGGKAAEVATIRLARKAD